MQRFHCRLPRVALASLAGLASAAAVACACGVTDTRASRHAAVLPVGLDEVRWTDGFWADRFEVCRTRSIPAMWEIMRGTKYKPYYQHFLIAAGKVEGHHRGAPFNDGDFYKWIEAACAALAQSRDRQLEAAIDQSIEAIGQAQRADGYLHTPVLIRVRNGDAADRPFQDRLGFEMYNMGHLLSAACIHHRVTGRRDFLKIAEKTADFLCQAVGEPTPELARISVCPSHYMGVVELYRTTGDSRYLRLAQTLLDMRRLVSGGGDDNQDRVAFTSQNEAVGHAVRANYLYAGAADLFVETGDTALWRPLESIWKNVVEKKMYVTGGCGALYDGAAPDGARDQSQISRVHQAYGRNYQLPNTSAHNETCANVANVMWNWRMFLVSGEARYIDVLELALYNSVLAGVGLDGTDYFYVNPLRNTNPPPTELRWSRTRVPYVSSYCCPPNLLRTIAETNGYAYSKTADSIWLNLYGGSKLSTKLGEQQIKLTQATNYPWDGHVHITIDECPAAQFSLKLRIPGWADTATLRLNGAPLEVAAAPATYADLRRVWARGDVVELDLPMPEKLIEANPLVEETRNQVAIKRGPLVYCLESPDLPAGVRVDDVVIPAKAKFTARHDAGLLHGVTVVEAKAIARSSGDWKDALYRPARPVEEKEVDARFIPYYAWSNRGPSEMSVWLPVK